MIWEALQWVDQGLRVAGWLVLAAAGAFIVAGLYAGARFEDLDDGV